MTITKNIARIEIRFRDLDRFDHVNNAVFLTYLEQARMKLFDDYFPDIDWRKKGVILARNEVDYIMPILLHDEIYIKTWCSNSGTKSFELSYVIYKKKNDAEVTVAKAKSVMVCFDYNNNTSFPIPEVWKKILTEKLSA